ncbi:hypothetical protein ACMHYO_13340 [Allopusillimonas ginsengisoli]|uniref:hypothetical protein n=1 Tax=Allopusillimonas ginsengisoli TaxID=453575 RepID=UPI0010C16E7F|nr:hypothetical protein D7I39_00315 [Allopusillimonas ginsengisoli]
MRLFNLYLRRAGLQSAPVLAPSAVSRFTVVCPRHALPTIRRQIYHDFKAAGLRVSGLQIDHAHQHDMARACVTVACPPEMRAVLMSRARELSAFPGVQQVHWGDKRKQHALN